DLPVHFGAVGPRAPNAAAPAVEAPVPRAARLSPTTDSHAAAEQGPPGSAVITRSGYKILRPGGRRGGGPVVGGAVVRYGFGTRKRMVASKERMPGCEPSPVVGLAASGVQASFSIWVMIGSCDTLRP